MRYSVTKLWAIALACVFVSTTVAASVGNTSSVQEEENGPTPTAGPSPRTVVYEEFTGSWCPPCANAAPAISRLVDEYPKNDAVFIGYHVGASDPMYDATVSTPRRNLYVQSSLFVPTAIVDGGGTYPDGTLWRIGAGASIPGNYDAYRNLIDPEKLLTTNIEITLSGDMQPGSATVTASIYASDMVFETNLMTRFVLVEDPIYFMGSNGEPFHRTVARALYETPLSIMMGQTVEATHTFTINPAWDINRIGVVAFVQSDIQTPITIMVSGNPYTYYNNPILQAAQYRFVKPSILYVKDDGTVANYNEDFEQVLSINNRPFEVWNAMSGMDNGNFDYHASPTQAQMAEYGAIVWDTGQEAMSTLEPADLTSLGSYLDGYGNLFVQGRRIATEIQSEPFLSNYLHASFDMDNSATLVTGVAGDPITGTFLSNMNILGSPSDQLLPASGGVTTLQFIGTPTAGVRADHDMDSRVVFFGVDYFHGSASQRNGMMDNILTWLDGRTGPKVTLITPNGGEEYAPGTTTTIEWSGIDVSIPTDGVDIYFTDTLSTPTWTVVSMTEPNDGIFTWTVPSVQTNDCGIRIVIRDSDMTTPDGEAVSAGPCTIGTPNVSITKDVSNPTPQVGEQVTYSVTLTNAGVVTANATVTDVIPVAVTYMSDDGGTTGTSNYDGGTRTLTWNVIVPGMSSRVLNIVVNVSSGNPGDTVWNTANFDSTDMSGGSPQSGSDQVSYQLPTTQIWSITLTPGVPPGNTGKFLLSVPLLLTDYRVTSVLMSIAGKYDYVRAYDPTDSVSPWKDYVPGRTYNSLREIRPHMGFWINMIQPGTLTVTGARPTTTNIVFNDEGWYLVGYPSLTTTYTIGDLKASIGLTGILAESYDVNSPPYNLWKLPDTYVMQPGEGYWIYVPAACTWSVTG